MILYANGFFLEREWIVGNQGEEEIGVEVSSNGGTYGERRQADNG